MDVWADQHQDWQKRRGRQSALLSLLKYIHKYIYIKIYIYI